MKTHGWLMSATLLLALSAAAQQAQKGIFAEGGDPDERASARVLYWDQKVDAAAGWFAINYGRPFWKKAYEDPAKFDAMTKGKVWRMGSNYWTTLDTCLPLKVSGKNVPVGFYYLGLERSDDGSTWSLAFIDPAAVRKAHVDAFDIRKAHVKFTAPMSMAKSEATTEKLTITLSYPKDDMKNVTMKLFWGNVALTAPIQVTVAE